VLDKVKELASIKGYEVSEIYKESKSSKAPGRPIFNQMLQEVYKGNINAILCWKLDRLARNPVDGGSIMWVVKSKGVNIITPSTVYSHENDTALLMYVEFGMAQKYIDDLGKNVKRGMKAKAGLGWFPAPAPLGYENVFSKSDRYSIINKDKKLFPVFKQMWFEVLRGKLPADVWREYSQNGQLISHSGFYKMLANSFYCGEFEYPTNSGLWYQGKHVPMVNKEEFNLVQQVLGDKGKSRRRTHDFTYRGIFRCGECGCQISATKKHKYLHKKDKIHPYVYYHCSKKSMVHRCLQKPITKSEVDGQILKLLGDVRIPQEFLEWALKWNDYLDSQKMIKQVEADKTQDQAIVGIKTQLDRLLKGYVKGLFGDKEYQENKRELEAKLESLEKKKTSTSSLKRKKSLNDQLIFAREAQKRFQKGKKAIKREVVLDLGSNFLIKDKNVAIQLEKIYELCSKRQEWSTIGNGKFELSKYADVFKKRPDLLPVNLTWLPD
jgi:site-specific DNA recombinase